MQRLLAAEVRSTRGRLTRVQSLIIDKKLVALQIFHKAFEICLDLLEVRSFSLPPVLISGGQGARTGSL